MTIRVLLADDQTLLLGAFAMLVESAPDMQVVARAETGRQAFELAKEHQPDVAVIDIRMPDLDGIEATRMIAADDGLGQVRVLILTTYDTDDNVLAALRAGASGFLVKDARADEMLDAIRTVAAGEALLSPGPTATLIARALRVPDQVAESAGPEQLTELSTRERDVLALVGRGLNNTEIAHALELSPLTAKTHVSRIMAKLAARDRAQLVVTAYESGLVVPGAAGQ